MEEELEQLLVEGENLIAAQLKKTRSQVLALTENQIREILEAMPVTVTPVEAIQIDEWVERAKEVYSHLKKIKLHPRGFTRYKDKLVRTYYRSCIQPGTNVGMAAADAAGTNTTQMTLNTFHVAGSATNAAFGIKVIREILELFPRSTKSIHIVYTKHLSFDDIILHKRPELIDVTFFSLLRDGQIEPFGKAPSWYDDFRTVYPRVLIPIPRYYYRAILNLDQLYNFHITPEKIYQAMRDSSSDVQMTLVYSPVLVPAEGNPSVEFHFIPNENKIVDGDSLTYLNAQLGEINGRSIQGLPDIREIYIIRVPLAKAITREQSIGEHRYELYFDAYFNRVNGINIDALKELFRFIGFTVLEENHLDYFVVENEKKLKRTPLEELKHLIEEDDKEQREYEQNKRKEKLEVAMRDKQEARSITILRPPSELELKAYTHYVETSGGLLTDVLDLEGIDHEAIFSNDIREMNAQFGIEAARQMLTKEIDQVFRNSKQPLERSSTLLLADYMTSRGFLTPFNLSGNAAHPIGTYSKATLQRPVEYFLREALNNGIDKIRSASSCIMTGRIPQLSTGAVKLIYEQKVEDYVDFVEPELVELPTNDFVGDEEEAAKIEEKVEEEEKKEEEKREKRNEVLNPVFPAPQPYRDLSLLAKLDGRAKLILKNVAVEYDEEHPYIQVVRYHRWEELVATMLTELAKYPKMAEKYLREALTGWLIEMKSVDTTENDPVLPSTDVSDFSLVKRLKEKGVSEKEAVRISKELAQKVQVIIDALKTIKKKKSLLKGEVNTKYNNKTKLWELSFSGQEVHTVSLTKELKDRLTNDYDGEKSKLNERMFSLLVRYQLLFGTGYQGAIPEKAFSIIEAKYEAFASPLNHTLEHYYSVFPDTDLYFGSKGSFFPAELEPGMYEVNPPFLESSILATVTKLLTVLRDPANEEFTFLLVLPDWVDLPSYRELIESEYNQLGNKVVVLKKKEHRFRNVPEGKEWMHGVDSHIFVLSNGKQQYGLEFEALIRDRFA